MPSTGDLMDTFVVDEKLDCTWESGSSSSGCGSHFEFPCPQDMLGDIGVEPGTVDWGSGIDDIMIRIQNLDESRFKVQQLKRACQSTGTD